MNDRYLFKAKRIDNGEWIVGNYLTNGVGNHFINAFEVDGRFAFDTFEIDELTLCQCTGLKDKNGTLIWENDIVEISKEDGYFSIDWNEDTAQFVINGDGLTVDFDNYWSHEIEIVGNRVDNPDLLEVE